MEKSTITKLVELLRTRRCGDHSCWFGHSGGVGTTGGCKHDKMSKHELQCDYHVFVGDLRRILDAGGGES